MLLDHHKTAIEEFDNAGDLPENLHKDLDINLSGATVALRHFKPKVCSLLLPLHTLRSLLERLEDTGILGLA